MERVTIVALFRFELQAQKAIDDLLVTDVPSFAIRRQRSGPPSIFSERIRNYKEPAHTASLNGGVVVSVAVFEDIQLATGLILERHAPRWVVVEKSRPLHSANCDTSLQRPDPVEMTEFWQ